MTTGDVTGRKPGRPRDPDLETRRRTEILDAAEKIFASSGFAGTDVEVIANDLGIGKGTIYRYFPTKKELFLATVDRGLAELSAEMDAILEDHDADPLDLIRKAFETYLGFFARRPEMTELFFQERVAFQGREIPRYFLALGGCQERDAAFLQELIVSKRLRSIPVEHLLTVLGDLLLGTVLSNHLTGRVTDPVQQSDVLIDLIFFGMLNDGERTNSKRRTN